MTEPEPGIPLADLVDAIREQLETAAARARKRKSELQFEVKDVTLEVEVTTTGSRHAKGGLQVWVLTLGAGAQKSNTAAHKVTLSLGAVGPDGSVFTVKDKSSAPVRRN
jgi:hypothetical protein